MKKILVFIFCLLTTSIVYAEEQKPNALIVKLNNGSENAFVLSEKPTIQIQDNKMLVSGVVEVTYLRSNISKFYFQEISSDDPRIISGIETVKKDNVTFSYLDGENVRITGLKKNTVVSVYTLDGKNISTQKSDGSDSITISLKNLPNGVYIISYNNRSIKIKI